MKSAFCASNVGKFASRKAFIKKPSSGIKRASGAARPSVITCASACHVFRFLATDSMENNHLMAMASLEESVAATSSSSGVPVFRSSTWT